jgi:FKBP-type peptidyl-prolyl cis-trans isomerase SlpA
VKEVNEDHVIIDGNHPLSGKDLIFDIEVVSFQ